MLAAALMVPARAGALTLQPIGSFDQPIYVTSDPANPNRIFVVQRAGLIKVVDGGTTSTFADLTSVVRCCEGERGLFSMALPSDFPQTGRFYVFYTGLDGPGNLHIAELQASGGSASINTLRNLLTIAHSQAANHNGGQLQFGPDGYLYIATGDGGSTPDNALDLTSLLGKVLRIDPRQSGALPYTVPASNPFVGVAGLDEIWAYGLRNPWRFSFDRQTGDLLLADVGQSGYEEVDYAPATAGLGRGADYGWDCREGLHPYSSGNPVCAGLTGYTDPIFEYPHANPGGGQAFGCAITGGYVVRDQTLGDLYGRYLYTDLCQGRIRSLVPGLPAAAGERSEGVTVSFPVSFGEDSCGRLYVAEGAANVYRLMGSGTPACAVLSVSAAGSGHGRITGPGINCPRDCTEVFAEPQTAVLSAHPSRRSTFSGWHRDCSGRGLCSVMMTQDRSGVARFKGPPHTHVRLRVARYRVPLGASALLRAKAFPCKGRRHDLVNLYRGRKRIDTKRLNRRCVARFRPRIGHRSRFFAKVRHDVHHRAGRSRRVTVAVGG
jgi:Glucose / Sorbosone dehydrogenase